MASKTPAWKALWPATLVLIILCLLTAGWFWAKAQAESGFAEQAKMYKSKTALTCGQANWSGYPFKLQLECTDPVIHFDRDQKQLRPQHLTGYVRAPSLKTLLIDLIGPTTLQENSQPNQIIIQHQPTTINVHARSNTTIDAEMELLGIELKPSDAETVTIEKARLTATYDKAGKHDIDLAIHVANLSVQSTQTQSLTIEEAETTIKVRNAPDRPVENATDWIKVAARQATMFELEHLKALYGETGLTANGAFKIEETGTINGSFETQITNLKAFLQNLQQRQILTPRNAQAASTLLGIFDTGSGVTTNLRFKDQQMYWGPIKLGPQTPLF